MEFKVSVNNGVVCINGEFVSALCFDAESVGLVVAAWLAKKGYFNQQEG